MATIAQHGAACTQVLATAELLEAILLEADPKTILLAQRVDTTFRDAIVSSPKLQERLFFKKAASKENDREDNPIIFRNIGNPRTHPIHCIPSKIRQKLGLKNDFCHRGGRYGLAMGFYTIDIKRCEKALQNNSASFLDMYLQQSADNDIRLQVYRPKGPWGGWSSVQMRIKPRVFRHLIAFAARLQGLAEYVTKWRMHLWAREWNGYMGELKSAEWSDWREFFTVEQRDMIVGPPKVLFRL